MTSTNQTTNPDLLTVRDPSISDQLVELAKSPRTRVYLLGEQSCLFSDEKTRMVEVINGSTRLTVSESLASSFGLYPSR